MFKGISFSKHSLLESTNKSYVYFLIISDVVKLINKRDINIKVM